MLRAVDAQVPDKEQQALDFFLRLDEARYATTNIIIALEQKNQKRNCRTL